MTGFACDTCFDTRTIDTGGREVDCPECSVLTVRVTGLGWGLGATMGDRYSTAIDFGRTFIEFHGGRNEILGDVARVAREDVAAAKRAGRTGRNSISSGALAIERRVRKALA